MCLTSTQQQKQQQQQRKAWHRSKMKMSHGFITMIALLVASMCWSTTSRLQLATLLIIGDSWQQQVDSNNPVPLEDHASPYHSSYNNKQGTTMETHGTSCDHQSLQPVYRASNASSIHEPVILKAQCLQDAPSFEAPSSSSSSLVVQKTTTYTGDRPIVAILSAIRSKRQWNITQDSLLQQYLIPSLLTSVTQSELRSWEVRLYLAMDNDDDFWLNATNWLNLEIPSYLTVHIYTYPHRKNHIPFNEIAKAAYDDGATYFCRVNDDSAFQSHSWITMATRTLQEYSVLPNVGVVGPTCLKGVDDKLAETTLVGNMEILTHDFVHRTHLEIFEGLYYPAEFHNWFVDDWITNVYSSKTLGLQRMVQLENWTLVHYLGEPRYRYDANGGSKLPGLYRKGLGQVRRYVEKHDPQHLGLLKSRPSITTVRRQPSSQAGQLSALLLGRREERADAMRTGGNNKLARLFPKQRPGGGGGKPQRRLK